jgi:hypothetical protein
MYSPGKMAIEWTRSAGMGNWYWANKWAEFCGQRCNNFSNEFWLEKIGVFNTVIY